MTERNGESLTALEQQMLLATIRLHPVAYGMAIRNELTTRTGKEHSVGTIYAALERLEDKGYVTSKEGEAQAKRGGRKKVYFTVSGHGRSTLDASLRSLDSMRYGLAVGVSA